MTSVSPSPGTTAAPSSSRSSRRRQAVQRTGIAAWVELTKPRIAVLLLVTCASAMFVAAGGMPSPGLLLATCVGLVLSSGGASALNHVLDRDIDRLMSRTALRPVASGTIAPLPATVFGIALLALSLAEMWLLVNPLAATLTLAGGLFYAVVYTLLLKRRTAQNIVIGGAAGAVPPLVGCAAVTGSLSLQAWTLFTVVLLWTPPHFWALALLIREEYARAGVPMLPVVAGEHATARQVWWYALALLAASLMPVALGAFGLVYAAAALLLGARLAQLAWQLRRLTAAADPAHPVVVAGTEAHALARSTFLFSMAYLALVFCAAVVDQALMTIPLT